ncbi:MAG: hypothetical protein A3F17_00840 [Gammaproteobacteria bacterium RIFCSPHIGHO2_12_FULL_41_15]|nr:MAG: hypothetical protein A3F17_00840 [Gammaproteobacteria bacterium RIFCSPHIGHO2_12_FULL_41_15]
MVRAVLLNAFLISLNPILVQLKINLVDKFSRNALLIAKKNLIGQLWVDGDPVLLSKNYFYMMPAVLGQNLY